MEKKASERNFIRILIPIVIVAAAICILKSGYRTGHWLYEMTHNNSRK